MVLAVEVLPDCGLPRISSLRSGGCRPLGFPGKAVRLDDEFGVFFSPNLYPLTQPYFLFGFCPVQHIGKASPHHTSSVLFLLPLLSYFHPQPFPNSCSCFQPAPSPLSGKRRGKLISAQDNRFSWPESYIDCLCVSLNWMTHLLINISATPTENRPENLSLMNEKVH